MLRVVFRKDTRRLDEIERRLPNVVDIAIKHAAEALVDDIRANWSGFSPPPSSPGETPHIETGELDASMRVEQNRAELGRFSSKWKVVFDSDYAAALEFGYSPRNLLPRPFIRPAVSRLQDSITDIFKDAWDLL